MPPRLPTGLRPFRSVALIAGGVGAIVAGAFVLWLSRLEPSTTGGVTGTVAIEAAHDHDERDELGFAVDLPSDGLFGGNSARLIGVASDDPASSRAVVNVDSAESSGPLQSGGRANAEAAGAATPGFDPGSPPVFAPARALATPAAGAGG